MLQRRKPVFYNPEWDGYFTEDKNYYQETLKKEPRRDPLDDKIDVDVCIIGGGFTGVSTAYQLRNSGLKVALIERHEIGWGASGRCGGQILPGYNPYTQNLQQKYGDEKTKMLWDIALKGVNIVKGIYAEHNIDCDFKNGAFYVARDAYESEEIHEYARNVDEFYQYPIEFKDKAAVSSMLGTDIYDSGIYLPQAGHFHPLKYLKGLAKVTDQYAQIFESCPAEAIQRKGDGYIVYVPNGQIRTKTLVLCGDSYLGNLVPSLRRKYLLIRNAIIGTEGLPANTDVLPSDACVFEVSQHMNYYRKGVEGSFLIGAGDIILQGLHGAVTQDKITSVLVNDMISIYPSLKDVKIEYKWGGYIGVTNSLLPNVGKLDDHVYYANGFSGHGVNVTHAVGELLAQAISGQNEDYKIFDIIRNASYPGDGKWDRYLGYAGLQMINAKYEIEKAWDKVVRKKK